MSLKIDYDINPADDAPKPISAEKRAAMVEGNDMLSGAERRRLRRQGHGHRRKAAIRPGDDFSKELEKSMTWPPPSLRSPTSGSKLSGRDAFTPITDEMLDEEKSGGNRSNRKASPLGSTPSSTTPSGVSDLGPDLSPAALQRLKREAIVRRRSQPPATGLACVPETDVLKVAKPASRYDALDQFRAKPSFSPAESKSGSPDRTSPSSSTAPPKPALSLALDDDDDDDEQDHDHDSNVSGTTPNSTHISEDPSGKRSVVDVWPRVELEYSPTGTSQFRSRAWTAVKVRDQIPSLPTSFPSEDDAGSSSSGSSSRSDGSPSPPRERDAAAAVTAGRGSSSSAASCSSSSSSATPTPTPGQKQPDAGHLDPSSLGVNFVDYSRSMMERNLAEETLVESLPFWHQPVASSGPLRHVRVWAMAGTIAALATGYLRVFGFSHVQAVRNWAAPPAAGDGAAAASATPIRNVRAQ